MPDAAVPDDRAALDVRRFGSFVRGRASFDHPVLGPSCAGDGVSAYLLFRDHIVRRDPWTIYEVNLQTEAVTAFTGQMCDCWFLKPMPDGCVYVFPEDTGAEPRRGYVARVNTDRGRLEIFGPSPDAWNYCHSWGPDRALYLGGYRQQRAARFDPDTGEFTDYGVQGPPVVEGIYHIVADNRFIYTTTGGDPYYLVSCERKTLDQKILMELRWPRRAVLRRRRDRLFVIVDIQRYTPRLTDPTEQVVDCYELLHERLTPIDTPAEILGPEADVDPIDLPGGTAHQPEVHAGIAADADGTATMWYRRSATADWRPVTLNSGPSDSYLFRLGTFGDGLIGSSEDPYHVFTFLPATGDKSVLGPIPIHVYDFQEFGGRVYFVGYAGAPVYEWDPKRPWNQRESPANDSPPDPASPEANPRLVVSFERQRRTYAIVAAADDRLYVPCSATVESTPGGLLGWYHPATGASGGVGEGFENHRGADVALAGDGRYVVTCTCRWPQDNLAEPDMRVVTYDTQSQAVAQCNPVPGCSDPGVIAPWRGTQVVGKVIEGITDRAHKLPLRENVGTTFYRYDAATNTPSVGPRIEGEHRGRLLCRKDGMIVCCIDRMVMLVDPTDWSTRTVGTLDESPRDWILLGEDLYAILGTEIARVTVAGNGA